MKLYTSIGHGMVIIFQKIFDLYLTFRDLYMTFCDLDLRKKAKINPACTVVSGETSKNRCFILYQCYNSPPTMCK